MSTSKEHTIKIGIDVDTSALGNLETAINKYDGETISLKIDAGGNALDTIDSISSKLDGLKDTSVKIDVGGNFEQTLNNIDGKLDSISKTVTTRVETKGNADKELKNIQSQKEQLGKPVTVHVDFDAKGLEGITDLFTRQTESIIGGIQGIASGMGDAFRSLNQQIAKTGSAFNQIGHKGDFGLGSMTKNIQGATSAIGTLQRELNSLSAPDITPNIQNQYQGYPTYPHGYYGGYSNGQLSLGGLGGSAILSSIGMGAAKDVIWGNSTQAQTNTHLLAKMNDATAQMTARLYEGGTTDIADAVTNTRMISMQMMIPQLYAFKTATNASAADLLAGGDDYHGSGSGVDILTAFGEHVALMTGSDQLAQSAMYDLSKGFKGSYSSIDQYGITESTLEQHGFKKGDKDVKKYLQAVGEIIGAYEPNELLSETTTGGIAQVRKSMSAAGKKIGNMFLDPVNDLANLYNRLDGMDFNIMGITIPKRTLSQTILGVTALTSSLGPLKETFFAVKQTFNDLKTGVSSAASSIKNFTDKLTNLRSLDKLGDYKQNGAYGILKRKRDYDPVQKALDVMGTEGIHNFTADDVMGSSMTRGQKSRTLAGMNVDQKLYDLEGGVPKDIKDKFYAQSLNPELRQQWMDKAKEKGYTKPGASDFIKFMTQQQDDYIDGLMDDYETGRKNEISKLSNWEKVKKGWKDSNIGGNLKSGIKEMGGGLKGVGKGFATGFLDGGGYGGIAKGLSGMKGGLSTALSGFSSFGSVLTEIVTAIGPVTIALAGLAAGIAGLAAIFMIAWSNSEEFRNKVGQLGEKLHQLFDTFAYTLGDLFQAAGWSESGGMDGVIEVANSILDGVMMVVDGVNALAQAFTGRDVKQQAMMDKANKSLKDDMAQIQKERAETGQVSQETYQKMGNDWQQLAYADPSIVKYKDQLYDKLGMDAQDRAVADEALERYYGAVDRGEMGNYVFDEQIPRGLNDRGVEFGPEDYMNKVNSPQDAKEFRSSIGSFILGQLGIPFLGEKNWYDTNFPKGKGLQSTPGYDKVVAEQEHEDWMGKTNTPVLPWGFGLLASALGKNPSMNDLGITNRETGNVQFLRDDIGLGTSHADTVSAADGGAKPTVWDDIWDILTPRTYDNNAWKNGTTGTNTAQAQPQAQPQQQQDLPSLDVGPIESWWNDFTGQFKGLGSMDTGGLTNLLSAIPIIGNFVAPFTTGFSGLEGLSGIFGGGNAVSAAEPTPQPQQPTPQPQQPTPTQPTGGAGILPQTQTPQTPQTMGPMAQGQGMPDLSGMVAQLQTISTTIDTLLANISTNISTTISNLTTAINAALTQITTSFTEAFTQVNTQVQQMVNTFTQGFTQVNSQVQQLMTNLNTGLTQANTSIQTMMMGVTMLGAGLMMASMGAMLFGTSAMMSFMMATTSLMMLTTGLMMANMMLMMMAASTSMVSMLFNMMSMSAMMISTYLMMANMALMQMLASTTMINAQFMMFGAIVAAAMMVALASIMMFSAQAIALMSMTGSGMVAAFTGSFHGVSAAVNMEMAAAYAAMAAWGARMIALAHAIGAAVAAAIMAGLNQGSPGDVYRAIKNEFIWAHDSMVSAKGLLTNTARSIGSGIVQGFRTGYQGDEGGIGSVLNPAQEGIFNPLGMAPPMVAGQTPQTPPLMEDPNVMVPQVLNNNGGNKGESGTVINNNLSINGFENGEELAKMIVRVINERFLWDAEKAGRTVDS